MRWGWSWLLSLLLISPTGAQAPARRPMQIEDLFRCRRLADPQVSPDGRLVVYVVTTVTDVRHNRLSSQLWLVPTEGGPARRLTNTPHHDRHPRWSPDGRYILFESDRSGSVQLWAIAVDGGEAWQVTEVATGAHHGIWSGDGQQIAFVSAVWPEYASLPFAESNARNRRRLEEQRGRSVQARVFTRLFFRHWDHWVEDKREHLFVVPWNKGQGGMPRDVTPADRDAYPTSDTFSLGDDFTFSADGKYLIFTAVPAQHEAWSTNYDLCRVPVAGGRSAWETLTPNPAADASPRLSPDGHWLAYRAQQRPGFEADRWQLYVVPVDPSGAFQSKPQSVTAAFDGSVEAFLWTADSRHLLFLAEKEARVCLFICDRLEKQVRPVCVGAAAHALAAPSLSATGRQLVALQSSFQQPAEVVAWTWSAEKACPLSGPRSLTQANHALLEELLLPPAESVTVPGADGTPMQMWLLKPPGFDPHQKWPLVYLVHGGPQGAWTDSWSYRWNPQLWAAQGYVVALPNPRGSTGFGQKYVDEISGDWGGKCYEDLMAGLAWLEKQPYVDAQRLAAAGASFGGYMINWFAVNTGKFKALISHCGVWNFESMYALTDELWFDEWEHGGPPWRAPESFRKYSPHRLAANLAKYRTPMLIIHNDQDFRVPVAEGLQLFTTLQRLGVPARMVNFPDEGHWVLRPANSRYWHEEVFGWLRKYVPPGGRPVRTAATPGGP
jgi:dipeptidyl aminopeptidase/acylaminoacyl peptidase